MGGKYSSKTSSNVKMGSVVLPGVWLARFVVRVVCASYSYVHVPRVYIEISASVEPILP